MPVLFFEYVLPFFFIIVLVGAAVLWTKTRRTAALVQLIACSIILTLIAVEQIASGLMRVEKPQLFDMIRSPNVQLAGQIILIMCFVALPVGYLWYALTRKRI